MDVEKNGGKLFRRPKLTLSCSTEGKEVRSYLEGPATHHLDTGVLGFAVC
jgi:hypothetical protein